LLYYITDWDSEGDDVVEIEAPSRSPTPTKPSTPSTSTTQLSPDEIKSLDGLEDDFDEYESYVDRDGIASGDNFVKKVAMTLVMIWKPEKIDRMIEIAPKLKYEDSQEGESKKKFIMRVLKRAKTIQVVRASEKGGRGMKRNNKAV
jgi:hypothetical protein